MSSVENVLNCRITFFFYKVSLIIYFNLECITEYPDTFYVTDIHVISNFMF